MTDEQNDIAEEHPTQDGTETTGQTAGDDTLPRDGGEAAGRVADDEGLPPDDSAEAEAEGAEDEAAAPESDPLARAERERDEYLELAQRTKAEFENYRKRMVAEVAAATERGKGEVAGGLVNVLDNLERALEAADVSPQTALEGGEIEGALQQGVALTYRELCGVLTRAGVEVIDPSGEKFDPAWHEAIQSMPSEEAESGQVIQVLQKGYRLGDRVLRPARVIVSA
jgi:molecular chaperone GrpE